MFVNSRVSIKPACWSLFFLLIITFAAAQRAKVINQLVHVCEVIIPGFPLSRFLHSGATFSIPAFSVALTLGVTLSRSLSVCVCPPSRLYHALPARRISVGGEGNALYYPVLSSLLILFKIL